MEPARTPLIPQSARDQHTESEADNAPRLEWETKAGKAIFYLTVACSLWFFCWLNGSPGPVRAGQSQHLTNRREGASVGVSDGFRTRNLLGHSQAL